MTKNYVLKPIYNDENECINDTLSMTEGEGSPDREVEGEGREKGAEVGGITEDSEGEGSDSRGGGEKHAMEEGNNVSPEGDEGNSHGWEEANASKGKDGQSIGNSSNFFGGDEGTGECTVGGIGTEAGEVDNGAGGSTHGKGSKGEAKGASAGQGRVVSKEGFILSKGDIGRDEEPSGGQMIAFIPFLEGWVPEKHTPKCTCI